MKIKNLISIFSTPLALALTLLGGGCHTQETIAPDASPGNPYGLSAKNIQWMRAATLRQLEGCRVQGPNGTWLHTPDCFGYYKALWTRDTYYMFEYAGDLLDPQEMKASIHYLLNGQRDDGCIPDRVNSEGKPIYSPGGPGKPMADHALDNGPFMALLACSYFDQHNDVELFREIEPQLRRGLDHIARADNGLVYNNPNDPQCVYGFTDIVKKTGHLLFCSLIYHDACMQMERICMETQCGDPQEYRARADLIRNNISQLWDESTGMFWAADQDCKQIDIWGNAFAIDIGITSKKQTARITDYLIKHHDQLLQRGQLRHLPPGDGHWQQLFQPCEVGTYQNGAYWATPLAWVIPVYAKRDPQLAQEMMRTVIQDFQENGINECVNGDYLKVPNFVVSAASVYSLTR